jgi:hypothetical protein
MGRRPIPEAGPLTVRVVRSILGFVRRCWTGEDMTIATGLIGVAMVLGVMWLIGAVVSTILRTVGAVEPVPSIGGWIAVAAYAVLGGLHDYRLTRRRRAHEASRARTRLRLHSFGLERLVTQSGRVIDADVDGLGQGRRLWRYDDEPGGAEVVAVEVLNSTPEADGSRRSYFLRVPPGVRTCRAAVAWTFGMRARDYDPIRET